MLEQKIKTIARKQSVKIRELIMQELEITFENTAIPGIKEELMRGYDSIKLPVFHKKSQLDPKKLEIYYEDFLDNFDYYIISDEEISFSIPTVEDLFESDVKELEPIGAIVEGLTGSYYEISQKQYDDYSFEKTKGLMFVVRNEPVYLFRSTLIPNNVKTDMKLKKELKPWPFRSSRDIFKDAIDYKDEMFNLWINEAKSEAIYRFDFATRRG